MSASPPAGARRGEVYAIGAYVSHDVAMSYVQQGGAESTAWEVLKDHAIPHVYLRELVDQLIADFDADALGYAQLHAIPNDEQRAVVSDEICQSAIAIRENFLQARLHQRQLDAIAGADGVRFPARATAKDTVLRGAEVDMAITGCVRALSSVLDGLGAVAVGVLRLPFSLHRAAFTNISQAVEPKPLAKGTRKQQELWRDLNRIIDAHRNRLPKGWLDWLAGMRNLNVHRARQVHVFLQRTRDQAQPQVLVMTATPEEVNRQMARFDLHLRKRPDLADMQDFVTAPSPGDLWINERAGTTLPGILSLTNDLMEEACQYLASCWRYAGNWSTLFPPPVSAWTLPQQPWPSFDGIAPSTTPFPAHMGATGPLLAERLRLAESLRL